MKMLHPDRPPGHSKGPCGSRTLLMLLMMAAMVVPVYQARAGEVGGMDTTSDVSGAPGERAEPATPDGLIAAGETCLENGDAARARDLFEEALRLRPDDARALLGLGRALAARRRYVEADALYRDMEERHIEAIQARLGRARLRSLQGDHEGARRFYRDALQAEPGNVEARLGMIREAHATGLDAQAMAQADAMAVDHPGNAEALRLQKEIHDSLAPHLSIAPTVQDDKAGNRVERATITGTFMAKPQTEVSVALSGVRTTSECGDAIDCAVFITPPPIDGHATTDARTLVGGTVIRIIRPLTFEGRVGMVQEDDLDGGSRTLVFGDGVIRWEAGPSFTMRGRTARTPYFDSAALVDLGVHLDTGELRLEYRVSPLWFATGTGELGRYSDGNAREMALATIAFQAPVARPNVTTTAAVRLARHHDDRDMGYLDPIRYDSETVTLAIADRVLDGAISWSVEGTWGRQSYDPNDSFRAPVAPPETPIAGGAARIDFALGDRVRLEASYRQTNDAFASAPGFPVHLGGLSLRVRL